MKFEWDESKNQSNFVKHGVWFEEAQTVWTDARALEFYDSDHSQNEERFIRVGISTGLKILLVIFCETEASENIRIISARKATKKEKDQYEERI
ncbi:BrnT family toxin [bacterium]|nr:BrnT family toxin [bacterium]